MGLFWDDAIQWAGGNGAWLQGFAGSMLDSTTSWARECGKGVCAIGSPGDTAQGLRTMARRNGEYNAGVAAVLADGSTGKLYYYTTLLTIGDAVPAVKPIAQEFVPVHYDGTNMTDLEKAQNHCFVIGAVAGLAAEGVNTGSSAVQTMKSFRPYWSDGTPLLGGTKRTAEHAPSLPGQSPAGNDIALGRQAYRGGNADVKAFAKRVGAAHFEQWPEMGLYDKDLGWGECFGQAVNRTIERGGSIHFDLTDLNINEALAGDASIWVGRYTAWELQQIVRNPGWFKHTTFYLGSQALTPEQAAQLGLASAQVPASNSAAQLGAALTMTGGRDGSR
jgi:hypothetical protein